MKNKTFAQTMPKKAPYLPSLWLTLAFLFLVFAQAKAAIPLAVDYEGRVVGAADFFTSDQQVIVATLPVHGVQTIYSAVGDLFAWLSIAGLLALIGVVIVQGKRKTGLAPAEQAREAEPLPLPEPVGERVHGTAGGSQVQGPARPLEPALGRPRVREGEPWSSPEVRTEGPG